ncbi:MAG TPA: PilZ domain-containing protein [Candidatus Deferrimicrobium sp.]|nr:PilZ domain-containing protein [Candidatus Deferrimicrobium sp.]
MSNRNEIRLDKKLLVNIGKDGFESMGLTSNISKNGLLVATTEVFPVDSEVSIQIGIGDETFTLKGRIMWSKDNTGDSADEAGIATGIQVTEAPAKYTEIVDKMLSTIS